MEAHAGNPCAEEVQQQVDPMRVTGQHQQKITNRIPQISTLLNNTGHTGQDRSSLEDDWLVSACY